MGEPVLWNGRISLGKAFALVYTDKAYFGQATAEADDFLLYEQSLDVPASLLDIRGGDSKGSHVHDCAGVLSAAAEVSAGYEVPFAQVRAALSASYNGQSKTSIVAVYGPFKSPFLRLWESKQSGERVAAAMRLYDWYLRYAYSGNELVLKAVTRGVAVSGLMEATRNASGSASLEGKVSAGFASAGIKGSTEAEQTTSVSVTDFRYAIPYKPGTNSVDAEFAPLPTPEKVVRQLADVLPLKDPVVPAVPGTRASHRIVLPGVGPRHCGDDKKVWELEPGRGAPRGLIISGTKYLASADGLPTCELIVEFPVPAEYARPTADGEFTIQYKVRATRPIMHNSAPHVLRFATTEVRFPVSRSPEIFAVGPPVEPVAADSSTLSWRTNLVFREDTATVDWSRDPTVSRVAISCPGADEIPASGAVRPETGRKTGELTIDVVTGAQALLDAWKGKPSNAMPRCTAKGVMRFQTRQSTFVDREFATLVRYPLVPKDAPAQVAAAGAAPAPTAAPSASSK